MTYGVIKISFGISPTSIYEILQKQLSVKKVCCRWITHNFTIAHKDGRVDWCNKKNKKNQSIKTEQELWDHSSSKDCQKVAQKQLKIWGNFVLVAHEIMLILEFLNVVQ